MQTVDEDHIGAGMIHLHEVEQPLAFIGTGMGLVRAPLLRTHARARPLRLRYFPDQSYDGPHAGDFCHGEPKSPVICDQQSADFPRRQGHGWRSLCEVYLPNQAFQGLLNLWRDAMTADLGAPWRRCQ